MFISLRKSQPEPANEPELLEDDDVQEEAEDQEEKQPDAGQEKKTGDVPAFLPALAIGVRDWLTWCSSRIGTGGTYAVHITALWAAGFYSLWVTYSVVLGLTLAVLAFTPRATLDRLADRIERLRKKTPGKADATSPEEAPVGPPADPLVDLLWKLIADAPGVHLKTLTDTLARASEKAGRPAPDRAAVKASLKARNIPVRPSVRDTRGKVNKGVHREDLQAWQNTPPPPRTPAPEPAP
ncbi:hypothetical protein [Streptomyces sp. NPDC047070]|uniref:hypothetical protein n=1 Tax=Streptomyces sp. NPDC047070 TaxID=3154923 RepID=UPI003452BDB0